MALDLAAFSRRLQSEPPPLVIPKSATLRADDGVTLAYDLYRSAAETGDVLIFYHGGGAHKRAGYDRLASRIAEAGTSVCLPDIRGHGGSGGPRGDGPSSQRIWADIDCMIAEMRAQFPAARLILGGHSSGAGYVLNAWSHLARRREIARLVFLAPEFGYRAGLARTGGDFARPRLWPFLVNAFSGGRLAGNVPAVFFPANAARSDAGVLPFYTVNMANAVTPRHPGAQLRALDVPLRIFYAAGDELIDPSKLRAFVESHKPAACQIAKVATGHLGVILDADPARLAS